MVAGLGWFTRTPRGHARQCPNRTRTQRLDKSDAKWLLMSGSMVMVLAIGNGDGDDVWKCQR